MKQSQAPRKSKISRDIVPGIAQQFPGRLSPGNHTDFTGQLASDYDPKDTVLIGAGAMSRLEWTTSPNTLRSVGFMGIRDP